MKLTDYIPLIAIFVTLIVGFLTFYTGILNYRQSRKSGHINIATVRRKERMDNLISTYSKLVALSHPDVIRGYLHDADYSFAEKVFENYSCLNMLFDHRFERDTHIANTIKKLTQDAIEYFHISNPTPEQTTYYTETYNNNILITDKLFNVFVGVEWSRIKTETLKGSVSLDTWVSQYENDMEYYEKWAEKYE